MGILKKEHYNRGLYVSLIVASVFFLLPLLYFLVNGWIRSNALIPLDYLFIVVIVVLLNVLALRGWLLCFYLFGLTMLAVGVAFLVADDIPQTRKIIGAVWSCSALFLYYMKKRSQT